MNEVQDLEYTVIPFVLYIKNNDGISFIPLNVLLIITIITCIVIFIILRFLFFVIILVVYNAEIIWHYCNRLIITLKFHDNKIFVARERQGILVIRIRTRGVAVLFHFLSIKTSPFRVQNDRYAYSICMADFDYVMQVRNRCSGLKMCCGQLYWKWFINCRHKISEVNIYIITVWFKEETLFEISYFNTKVVKIGVQKCCKKQPDFVGVWQNQFPFYIASARLENTNLHILSHEYLCIIIRDMYRWTYR